MPESPIHVFALQIEESDRFIDIFGPAVSSAVWEDIVDGYEDITRKILGRHKICASVTSLSWGRCFLTFILNQPSLPVDQGEQISAMTVAGRQLVQKMLQKKLGASTGTKLAFKIFITPIQKDYKDIEGIDEKLAELFKTVPCSSYPFLPITRDQFVKAIENKGVETFVQPIVSLPKEELIGYEALSRGLFGTSLQGADLLFGTAAHLGLTEELELVCIEKALEWITKIPANLWLSINVGPSVLKNPAFADIIHQKHLKPFLSRLIFELTEHLPIDSVTELQESIRLLKNNGINVSLDDTGCGFFDLHTVETFRPKIVKLCLTVIHRIGRNDDILREFNDTLSRIAKFSEYILGEGVEQRGHLDALKQCGVPMAQGYYFDKPKPASEVFK